MLASKGSLESESPVPKNSQNPASWLSWRFSARTPLGDQGSPKQDQLINSTWTQQFPVSSLLCPVRIGIEIKSRLPAQEPAKKKHPMQIMTKKLAIYLVPLIQGLKAIIFMHGDVATSADEFQLLRQTAEISWNVDMEAHEIMNLIWSHISFIICSNQVFKYIQSKHTSRSLAEVEDSICSSTCHKIHKQGPYISINFIKFRGHRRHLEKPALVAFSCSLKRSNAMSSLCTSSGCLVDKGIRICRLKRADWCSFCWVCCRCWWWWLLILLLLSSLLLKLSVSSKAGPWWSTLSSHCKYSPKLSLYKFTEILKVEQRTLLKAINQKHYIEVCWVSTSILGLLLKPKGPTSSLQSSHWKSELMAFALEEPRTSMSPPFPSSGCKVEATAPIQHRLMFCRSG